RLVGAEHSFASRQCEYIPSCGCPPLPSPMSSDESENVVGGMVVGGIPVVASSDDTAVVDSGWSVVVAIDDVLASVPLSVDSSVPPSPALALIDAVTVGSPKLVPPPGSLVHPTIASPAATTRARRTIPPEIPIPMRQASRRTPRASKREDRKGPPRDSTATWSRS